MLSGKMDQRLGCFQVAFVVARDVVGRERVVEMLEKVGEVRESAWKALKGIKGVVKNNRTEWTQGLEREVEGVNGVDEGKMEEDEIEV